MHAMYGRRRKPMALGRRATPLVLFTLGSLFLGHGWSPVAGGPESAGAGRGKNRYAPHPPVKEIVEGMHWPEGQALPIFATPAATLDTIEVQALSIDEQITFSALQGQINRKKPRIYLVDARSDEGRDTWASTATVAFGAQNTYGRERKYDLAAKYAGEIEGGRLRFDRLVIPYAGTLAHLRGSLERELGRWDGKSPVFLGYQVSIWGEMKPDRIVELVREVNERFPDAARFVRADHYFNLYNEAHGLPFNLVLSRSTKVETGAQDASPELAADGTPTSLWISSGRGPRWLRFDFGGSCRITRYLVRHAGASGMGRDFNTRDYTVQASADGESWQTIDAVRGNRENVTDVDLGPVSARYLKITVDDGGGDSTARIGEVEIFGNREGA